MDDFRYHGGALHCESVPADALAGAAGTPCYVYSAATLRGHFDRMEEAFASLRPLICFSVKSCPNTSILRLLVERGAGLDLVSGGELHRGLLAGADPARCVYAGVGKTMAEVRLALRAGVGWFNVESEDEFRTLRRVAAEEDLPCRAALRINPDVDAGAHRYTTTGVRRTKFGIDHDRAAAFFDSFGGDACVRLSGLHLHIGSPVEQLEPYARAIERALALADELAASGRSIEMLDIGGGFAADYESDHSPLARDYAARIVPLLRERVERGLRVVIEPGRSIAANAGVLLVRVLVVKRSGDKTFLVCDGGMNALLRPSHYGAFHFIWPTRVQPDLVPPRRTESPGLPGLAPADVVGPICETGDFLALDRPLPEVAPGALLAVFGAGAYGISMASRYNSMPLPPEVLVDGDRATLIRRRETYDDLIVHEREPARLVLREE